MKRFGIKYQILIITLIPVLLIDFVFTYTHINSNIDQASELLRSKGQIIARQIAGASEFNLYSGNDSQIQYLLDQSVDTSDIVLASVYDHQGKLIGSAVSRAYRPQDATDYFYFRQPIMSQSISHADIFTPDFDNLQQARTMGWVHLYISHQHLARVTQQIIRDSVLFFIAILFIAVLMTVIISRRITRPVFQLMDHLKDVETGQLGKVIEPVEENEIGAVQRGFNRMTQALLANRRQLNQRIQQATQQLNLAITDLESKNRELGFARDEAQNANRIKSKFLANMSHEIRTPINGIKGFISLLSRSTLDTTQQRYVEIIDKSIGDLSSIVNEILDFSKMESGKMHIVDEPFDLYEVIEQTRDILFINVLTKNIDLNLIIYSDTPRLVIGDKLRLKQILLNLIGNAIKFTDRGQVVIRVSAEEIEADETRITIAIEDSGIGISEADQQTLFRAFSQVDSSDNRHFTGTGLGLVISKNLATLMGGDISMHSIPEQGSEFVLQLTFKLVQDAPAEPGSPSLTALILAARKHCLLETRTLFDRAGSSTEASLIENASDPDAVREIILRNLAYIDLLVIDLRHFRIELDRLLDREICAATRVILINYNPGRELEAASFAVEFVSCITTSSNLARLLRQDEITEAEPVPPRIELSQQPKQVLLVDDNPVNLKLASELIRLWGHRVTAVDHPGKVLEIYRQQDFDLVILDIQMPDIDGASLLQMMRESKPDDLAPMVALTANIQDDEAERLLDLGFDYFLGKPIDEERFHGLLDGNPQGPGETSMPESPDIECILDFDQSLALSAGSESLLRQIFEILQRDIPDHQQQLIDALREHDLDRLAAIAHKLHGVTCYASLPRLRHKLVDFQHRLARDSSLPLEPQVDELISELNSVKAEVERLLADIGTARKPT